MSLIVETGAGSFVIPDEFRLPGGYLVRTTRRGDRWVNKECGRRAHACWDSDLRLVILRKSREGRELVEDYVHEMQHAFTDWTWHMAIPNECPCAEGP